MMKKLRLALVFILVFSLTCTAYADVNGNSVVNHVITESISTQYAYFDPEIDAEVIAFEINDDGTIHYLSKAEAESIISNSAIESETSSVLIEEYNVCQNDSGIVPFGEYREWGEFTPSRYYRYTGPVVKLSGDLRGPGTISYSDSFTVSHEFSTNVTGSKEENVIIQAAVGISWLRSATATLTYELEVKDGKVGYVGYYPYYNAVDGNLKWYSNWDGLLFSKSVTGYSVRTLQNGYADGLYTIVYY